MPKNQIKNKKKEIRKNILIIKDIYRINMSYLGNILDVNRNGYIDQHGQLTFETNFFK